MAAVRTFQVTLTGSAQPISAALPTGYPPLGRQIVLQNNDAAVMRVGDSTVTASKGYQLASGGAANSALDLGQMENPIDLSTIFVIGTATQKLDVTYVDE